MQSFAFQDIYISEMMAANTSGLTDEDGDHSDWIELHNPTSKAISLNGWFISDDLNNKIKWLFPDISLNPGEFFVLFASGKNRRETTKTLHTNFKLSSEGENVVLTRPDRTTTTFIFNGGYPSQISDISYAWYNNGFIFCAGPTPGMSNSPKEYIRPPVLGNTTGVCWKPVQLNIAAPDAGATIIYTLDGSVPSLTNGFVYTGEIEIGKTTILRAIVIKGDNTSEVVTGTFLFLKNVLAQPDSICGYPNELGKYNTLEGRAIADYGMDPEIVEHYVADSFYAAFLSLPILSIVSDKNHFFRDTVSETLGGIYMYTGSDGNSIGDGWERPVSVEYFSNDTLKGNFTINCGIRLQGGEGRVPEKSPKHSFRLIFRSQYGASKLHYPLFDDTSATKKFDNLVLRAGFCNTWHHWDPVQRKQATYIRDAWYKDSQLAMGYKSAHSKFVHLFINGLYWGLYDISERVDKDFMETYLGGDETEYDIIKDYGELSEGVKTHWNKLFSLSAADMSNNANYFLIQGLNANGTPNDSYAKYIDMENFIDYMLINFYGGNTDWDHHNWIAARNRVTPGNGFQFFCWDGEHILKLVTENVVSENNSGRPSQLYTRFRQNEEFKMLFADRVYQHFFNNGALISLLNYK
ncbi:MAG: CotH kinase family protein [Bacteroidales bacterium]|nr:CotH kinase family protein [Bacteroidales bacterium]